jgi:hypothetical protein
MWFGFSRLRIGSMDTCEHSNEPSGSTKAEIFLDQLNN